ncbi:phenol hydroxylase subunit [Georgfuchsia toluolica]|uniref:phenol hydroxylase subunit n=1 Tax=Georgfuchsia toluolica TaxID=424218 RepID=UPI001C730C5C|nr:phenol hydroxylase subunit [Georgfuchsia toluolica]
MAFDPKKKFVRITELRDDGFVEFDFAVGEPELFAEMILPSGGFDEFCAINGVVFLNEKSQLKVGTEDGTEDMEWRLRDAVHHRFK